MWHWNKRLFTSIMLGILFSILFASADDVKFDEEKSIASIPLIQPASAHVPGVSLTGVGTATIDGVLSPGEWDGAGQISVFTGAFAGSTFFVMNDANNLYLALEVVDSTLTPGDSMGVRFDNTHDGVDTDGDDGISTRQTGLVDTNFLTGRGWGFADPLQHGMGTVGSTGSKNFIEASKPLNSGDSNDFSLSFGDTVGFCLRYFNDGSSSTSSTFPVPPPPSSFSHIGCVGGAAQQSLYGDIVITKLETKYIKLNADEFSLPSTRGMTTEVMINGYVEDYSRGTSVYLIIENPNGEIETQKLFAAGGDYTTRIYLQHDSQVGEYKITTEYNGVNVDTISFVVMDKSSVKPSTAEPAPEPVEAPASTGPQTVNVSIPPGTSVPGCEETNECFMPSFISINVGDTVTWTNDDTASHRLTSGTVRASPDLTFSVSPDGRAVAVATGSASVFPDGMFDTTLWYEGDTFSVTYDKEGTYPYYSGVWQIGCVIVGRGDTICPAAPESDPSPSISEGMKLFEEILSESGMCEGLVSVDEVKTAIGYTGELQMLPMNFPVNNPEMESVCMLSFQPSTLSTKSLTVMVMVFTSAEHVEKGMLEGKAKMENLDLEIIEGVSETGWKFKSMEMEEGLNEESGPVMSAISSQKDRSVVGFIGSHSEGEEPLADLSQLHEIAKIVWEKMDKKISTVSEPVKEKVPGWIKNNAKWWSEGQIGDSDFVGGIQFMIKEKIINIPDLPEQASATAEEHVPDWIRNNAGWWADGLISEDDFVNGLKWLVEKGIIKI